MKRTNQLVAESAVIGFLFVLTIVGGSLMDLGRPAVPTVLSNPAAEVSTHDPEALSLYYNNTLSLLGEGEFGNVSQMLRTFPFVNVSPSVNQTAQSANSEIAAMNVSVSKATLSLNASQQQILAHELVNASALAKSGCAQAAGARGTYSEFGNSTSPALESLGIPAQPYSVGEKLVDGEIASLGSECQNLLDLLSYPSANLTISSPQSSIATGGPIALEATLERTGAGLTGQSVLFYLNGSYIGRATTGGGGVAQANLSIPYVYKPQGIVTAIASANESIGLQAAASNSLDFSILFTGTRIIVGDPSSYLPTFSFAVRGSLFTTSGAPLPRAPVKITFFNGTSYATTGPTGAFGANLTVPANAPDGVAHVFLAFSPQGMFGPSTNATSIEVTRLPLKVTLDVPKLSLAGFATTVSGSLTANGTAVAGATVIVASPWGQFQTQSDGGGRYSLAIPVSISEFALARDLRVSATPPQTYITPGQATGGVSLLNPLLIIMPTLGAGVAAYEFQSLGLLPKRRVTVQGSESAKGRSRPAPAPATLAPTTQSSRVASAYLQAVALARVQLGIDFKESTTMREMIRAVAKSGGTGAPVFSRILLTAEDFLCAREFDLTRVDLMEEDLSRLRSTWSG